MPGNILYCPAFFGEATMDQVLCKEAIENLDVIPANIDLSGAEIELLDTENKEYILRDEVLKIRSNYDYVIINCHLHLVC